MYHLHIPAPDPMTNPSTQTRAQFYEIKGTPSYGFDGKIVTGGGSKEETQRFYDDMKRQIEAGLQKPAAARLDLSAAIKGPLVTVKAAVDDVKAKSSDLTLHIALLEHHITYSGQSGTRFHPMVVRSLGGEKSGGFKISASGKSNVEQIFDLQKISAELKSHLDDFEKERKITFYRKKHEIDRQNLSVAAFVQNAKSKEILQAAVIKVRPEEQSISLDFSNASPVQSER